MQYKKCFFSSIHFSLRCPSLLCDDYKRGCWESCLPSKLELFIGFPAAWQIDSLQTSTLQPSFSSTDKCFFLSQSLPDHNLWWSQILSFPLWGWSGKRQSLFVVNLSMTNNHIFVPHNYVYSEHTFNAINDKTRDFVVFDWKEELVKV